jgi:hypothetical protein
MRRLILALVALLVLAETQAAKIVTQAVGKLLEERHGGARRRERE